MNYTEIQLKVEKVATTAILDLNLLYEVDIKTLVDFETRALVLRLSRYVACTEEKAIETIKYPNTAWQHIKQDYFPKWLLRKYPVEYRTVTVRASEMFPDLKISPGARRFTIAKYEDVTAFYHP